MEDSIVVVIHCCVVILVQHIALDQLFDRILCQVRIDSTGTVAEQSSKMVYLSGFTGFQDQCDSGSLLGAYQILVQGGYCQQGRNGHMVLVHTSVGQNQDIHTVSVSSVHFHEQTVNGTLKACVLIIYNRYDFYLEAVYLHVLDLQQIGVGQDRVIHLQNVTILRGLFQNITLSTDVYGGRGHDLLTDGIDGRVGHLSEQLLEIMEQRMIRLAQNGKRRIHAHGCDGFAAILCHRQDALLHFIIGVAKSLLHPLALFVGVFRYTIVRDMDAFQFGQIVVQPFSIRLSGSIFFLDLLVVDDSALYDIDQEHLAGTKSFFYFDLRRINGKDTYLGGQDQGIIIRDQITGRTQTVSVQHGSHDISVGEEDGCGAIPWLHHGSVILVEISLSLGHCLVVRPGFGDSDHHCQRQLHAAHYQEFQGIIQHSGVGTGLADCGQYLVQLSFQMFGFHVLLTGQHLIGVAADGVDLTVVYHQTVRMRTLPAGVGIGGEAGVYHGDG